MSHEPRQQRSWLIFDVRQSPSTMRFISHLEARLIPGESTLRVTVPAGLTSPTDLLRILAVGLRFPSYFGHNWDALFDCLCDFTWLNERRIVIIHEDVPSLPPPHTDVYLKVLRDAVDSWQPEHDPHSLEVAFPDSVISSWESDGSTSHEKTA